MKTLFHDSHAARSVGCWGLYLAGLGAALTFGPNLLLGIFGIAPTSEVWVHMLGVIVFNLGLYYIAAARSDAAPFFRISVLTRTLVLIACIAFVALGWVKWTLILVGATDTIGSLWTALALRRDAQERLSPSSS